MWKIILCQFGFCDDTHAKNEKVDVLYNKIKVLLYRSQSLTHFRVVEKLLKQYEIEMYDGGCPLHMVEKYDELVTLWNHRFKLWKRG